MRSGTLATHQIVGMGAAFALAKHSMQKDNEQIKKLSDYLLRNLQKIKGFHLNGGLAHKIPHCLNVYFDGVDGESLLLSLRNLAISTGSACNSANPDASHVLLAMGLDRKNAYNSLRISLGKFTTTEEIEYAANYISEQVSNLRELAPL